MVDALRQSNRLADLSSRRRWAFRRRIERKRRRSLLGGIGYCPTAQLGGDRSEESMDTSALSARAPQGCRTALFVSLPPRNLAGPLESRAEDMDCRSVFTKTWTTGRSI